MGWRIPERGGNHCAVRALRDDGRWCVYVSCFAPVEEYMYIKHGTSSQRHQLGFLSPGSNQIGERLPVRFAPNYPSVRYRRKGKKRCRDRRGAERRQGGCSLQFSTNGGVLPVKRQHRPSKTNLYRPTHDRRQVGRIHRYLHLQVLTLEENKDGTVAVRLLDWPGPASRAGNEASL